MFTNFYFPYNSFSFIVNHLTFFYYVTNIPVSILTSFVFVWSCSYFPAFFHPFFFLDHFCSLPYSLLHYFIFLFFFFFFFTSSSFFSFSFQPLIIQYKKHDRQSRCLVFFLFCFLVIFFFFGPSSTSYCCMWLMLSDSLVLLLTFTPFPPPPALYPVLTCLSKAPCLPFFTVYLFTLLFLSPFLSVLSMLVFSLSIFLFSH